MKETLTSLETQIVQDSWNEVLSRQKDFAQLFYINLFTISPELKKYFKSNSNQRNIKFISTLSLIVSKLHKSNALYFDVKYLGERHVSYGASPEHYALVGKALLITLKDGLGNRWNADLESAWTKLYSSISEAMIKVYLVYQNKQLNLTNVMDGNN